MNVDDPLYILAVVSSSVNVSLMLAVMELRDWLTITALIVGPILAVQAQKIIEAAREKRNQRLWVFKRLMATRALVVSPSHVEALNMIDLEFPGKKYEAVRRRWKEYLDNLASLTEDQQKDKASLDAWGNRNQDLLTELLHEMGVAVGYDFDKVQIKRGIYSPKGHANLEFEAQAIRRLTLDLLLGNRALPLDVRSLPTVEPPPSEPPNPSSIS